MLNEVLGEDELNVIKRKAFPNVYDTVDAGARFKIQIDPARQNNVATAQMNSQLPHRHSDTRSYLIWSARDGRRQDTRIT